MGSFFRPGPLNQQQATTLNDLLDQIKSLLNIRSDQNLQVTRDSTGMRLSVPTGPTATILVTSDAPVTVNGYQHYTGYIQQFDDSAGTWQNSGTKIWVVPASGENLIPGMYAVALRIGNYQSIPVYTVAGSLVTGIVRLSSTTPSGTTAAGHNYYPGYLRILNALGGIVDGPAVNVAGYNTPASFGKSTSIGYLAFCLPAPYNSAGWNTNGQYGAANRGPFWYAFAPAGVECVSTDSVGSDTAATVTNVTSLAVDQGSGLNLTPSGTSDSVQAVISAQPASATHSGVVNTTAQTFAGDKTFTNNVIVDGNGTVDGSLTVGPMLGGPATNISLSAYLHGSSTGFVIIDTATTNTELIMSVTADSGGNSIHQWIYHTSAYSGATGNIYIGSTTAITNIAFSLTASNGYLVHDGYIASMKGFIPLGITTSTIPFGATVQWAGGVITSVSSTGAVDLGTW